MYLLDDSADTSDVEVGAGDLAVISEEMQKEHQARRAKLNEDLNNLNKMLGMKEDLVVKMKASDQNFEQIKADYEVIKDADV